MAGRKLTREAQAAWREAALHNRPWLHATGPRTDAGKKRAAANAKVRQRGPHTTRELRAIVKAARQELKALDALVHAVEQRLPRTGC